MYKYFSFVLLFFIFFVFIPEKSISNETSKTPQLDELECITALNGFTLPQAFKKVGASNIEIKEMDPYKFSNTSGRPTRIPKFLYYKILFSVDNRTKEIDLTINTPVNNDAFNSTEVLAKFKNFFSDLPEKVLTLVSSIHIEYRVCPIAR